MAELLALLDGRGLKVVVLPSGKAVLRGDRAMATPALMRVVGLHRDALIAAFAGRRLREFRWPSGTTAAEATPCDGYPDRAVAWRWKGDENWTPIERGGPA